MTEEKFELKKPDEVDRGPFQGPKVDFEATRRRKALCLKNALTIVERFGMNPVSREMIAIALPWLEREQYDDIPVERVGYGNCGYLLCLKPASVKQFKQQYRIDVARRRVYEVGDRKYFCSDWCYRASSFLRRQIPTEPAWCRPLPTEPMPNLKFLSADAPGKPGKTVLDALRQLRLNSDIQNERIKGEFSSSEEESVGQSSSDEENEEAGSSPESMRLGKEKKKPIPWNEIVPRTRSTKIVERKHAHPPGAPIPPTQANTERNEVRAKDNYDLPEAVLTRLREWLTKEAIEVLFRNETSSSSTIPPPPSPHSPEENVNASSASDTSDVPKEDFQSREEPLAIVMPLVDSVSQHTYRARLLMECLLPSLRKQLFRMEMPTTAICEKFQNVVTKFHLTNKNIHLRPREAGLMSLCLLHLLLETRDAPYLHSRLAEMVTAFDGVGGNAEHLLASVTQLADKICEENLESPS